MLIKSLTIGNRLFYFQTNHINTKYLYKKSEVNFLSIWYVTICVCMGVCVCVCVSACELQPTSFELGS